MNCVKCDGILGRVKLEGYEVDQCPKCAGIWFDLGELEDTIKAERVEILKRDLPPHREHDAIEAPCPVCGGLGRMVPVHDPAHKLHIDTCTVCYGHWLDGGELDRLREQGLLSALLAWMHRT